MKHEQAFEDDSRSQVEAVRTALLEALKLLDEQRPWRNLTAEMVENMHPDSVMGFT